jgi:hypothetical protein
MKTVRAVIVSLAWLATNACGDNLVDPRWDDIDSAPTVLRVEHIDVTLEADLWRDFQPVAPPDGRGLAAVVRLTVDPFSGFRPDVVIESLHVVYGDEIWSSVPEKVPEPGGLGVLVEAISRNGPKWGPNVSVDVVAKVRTPDGTSLLKAPSVLIQRTD